ncbi:benzoate/H(+) symporter BenE family transporter [Halalkalibacterium ligniniphilum]|uniref:benzoate/H(+) symporter BenE family transporter n=1 Tax=Halalkalibacterium ligniniphilum TaxID=1134413 RepID=UPI000348CD70|nr:benzoate/H(+) symporter BenE family transporter [Halalkalibacterium ligniniphilum]
MSIERGTNVRENIKDFFSNLTPAALGTGLVAALFSIMGPGIIVMNAANEGNLPMDQAVSWLSIIYITGGIFTIILSFRYRQPIVVAYSIPGAVLVGSALQHIPFNEAIGAFIVVGVVVTILGLSGLIKKVIEHIPLPVMLGMIAGVLLSFGIKAVQAAVEAPAVAGSAFIVFFLLLAMKKFSQKFPPILGAIIVGGIIATALGQTNWGAIQPSLAQPALIMPAFSIQAILELSLPLIILVIGVQNMQAVGVLLATGYKPPINAMFTVPGIGTLINSIFGGHPTVIAGPSTAMVSSEASGKDKNLRYVASAFDGLLWICFGLVAGIVIAISTVVPGQLLSVLGGLAIFAVFISTFAGAFSGKFKNGAMVAFLIAVSNITLLSVGAAFWALLVGFIVSILLDRDDFRKHKEEITEDRKENIA